MQFHAVGQHANAWAVHAANDGAAGPGAKVGGVNAKLTRQAFAQSGCALQLPCLPFQHAHRCRHILRRPAQSGGGHGHAGQNHLTGWMVAVVDGLLRVAHLDMGHIHSHRDGCGLNQLQLPRGLQRLHVFSQAKRRAQTLPACAQRASGSRQPLQHGQAVAAHRKNLDKKCL